MNKKSYVSATKAKEIARRITVLREQLGWSQSEMSRAVEATRGACSHWEAGNAHKMTLENGMRLASQLGSTLDFICNGREGGSSVCKECLTKAVTLSERLAPRASAEQKAKLIDIAYALCAEDKDIPDSVILRLVSLESR